VLFTVSGWPTHYRSMIPLGWALQAAGYELRVLCPPSETESVGHAGLTPVPVLSGMSVALRNRLAYFHQARAGAWPYPWLPLHPLTGRPMSALDEFDLADYRRTVEPGLIEAERRSFDSAISFARQWRPQLTVFDPQSLEGLLVGRVLGIPALLSLWGPVGTDEHGWTRIVVEDLSESFARHGAGEMCLAQIEHVLDYCPPSLQPPTRANRLPTRFTPYNGPGPVPQQLVEFSATARKDRPVVVVAWSTALSTMSGPGSFLLPKVVAGLSTLGVDVVLAATSEDCAALGPAPPFLRILENCPLHLLLPHARAVVHHGGAGSTMTALCTGVPQLSLTCAPEQTANGQRVAAAGAGLHLYAHEVDADAVGTAVGALLDDPRYRDRATELRAELLAMPTPAQRVETLEALAG